MWNKDQEEEKGKKWTMNTKKPAATNKLFSSSCGTMMCQTRFHKTLTQSNKLFMMYHIFDHILMAFAVSFYKFTINKCSLTCTHTVVYMLELQSTVEFRLLFMTWNSEPWIVLNSFVCYICRAFTTAKMRTIDFSRFCIPGHTKYAQGTNWKPCLKRPSF